MKDFNLSKFDLRLSFNSVSKKCSNLIFTKILNNFVQSFVKQYILLYVNIFPLHDVSYQILRDSTKTCNNEPK